MLFGFANKQAVPTKGTCNRAVPTRLIEYAKKTYSTVAMRLHAVPTSLNPLSQTTPRAGLTLANINCYSGFYLRQNASKNAQSVIYSIMFGEYISIEKTSALRSF